MDSLGRRTVDLHVSVGKVHFRKKSSVAFTFESITLKTLAMSCGPENE